MRLSSARVGAGIVAAILLAGVASLVLSRGAGLRATPTTDRQVWTGAWRVPASAFHEIWTGTDADALFLIDHIVVARQTADTPSERPRVIWLEAGWHAISAQTSAAGPLAGPPFEISRAGRPRVPLASLDVKPERPQFPAGLAILRGSRLVGVAVALAGVLLLITRAARRWRPVLVDLGARQLGRPAWTVRRLALLVLASIIVGYGALLRFDAITLRYGPVREPAWLASLQRMRAANSTLRPAAVSWSPVEGRYISDPYTYLIHARELDHFYEASLREPVFPFTTRVFLALLNNQDVAVSFASAAFSVGLIALVFLLGTYAWTWWVGAVAAAALAIEYDAITWGVSGWRDDAFAAAVVATACALLRVSRTRSLRDGAVLGVVAGVACLIRITSLSFIIPGFIWLLVDAPRPRRPLVSSLALATLTTAVIVAPFLINCWRVYGDPLYSINVHAAVYEAAAGAAAPPGRTAAGYLRERLRAAPFDTIDTFAVGMTAYPFENKWRGFERWADWLGPALAVASLVGMVVAVATRDGRLLLVLLAASLVPYAFTWKLGADWRFTAHAYPFFLVAAPAALFVIAGFVRRLARDGRRAIRRPTLIPATIWVLLLAGGTWMLTTALPREVRRDELRHGLGASLVSGDRDRAFLTRGWTPPLRGGNVSVRVTRGPASEVQLPLLPGRPYQLTIRADPFPRPLGPQPPGTADVRLNGDPLGWIQIEFDPLRVGSARFDVPAARVRSGVNRLTIHPLASTSLAVWMVRIHPLPASNTVPLNGFGTGGTAPRLGYLARTIGPLKTPSRSTVSLDGQERVVPGPAVRHGELAVGPHGDHDGRSPNRKVEGRELGQLLEERRQKPVVDLFCRPADELTA